MRTLWASKRWAALAVVLVFLTAGCAALYHDRDAARSAIERARQAIASAEARGVSASSIEAANAHLETAVKELNLCRPIPARAAAERAIAALGAPAAAPAPLVEKLIFENDVFFDFDKDNLKAEAVAILEEILPQLKDNSKIVVRLAGHTDSVGPEIYNVDLSRRRAQVVERWFIDHGISDGRITTSWFGETQPRTTNDTREGRAINRRTEIDLILLP